MDEAEYKELVESAYHGRVLIGVDRVFARKVYTDLPPSTIQEANLHAGTVHVRTELGIAVDLMHYPVVPVLAHEVIDGFPDTAVAKDLLQQLPRLEELARAEEHK